jgi:hypothetical protein
MVSFQAGFGWTNGVILDLLTTFGDRIEFKNDLEMNPNAVAKEVIDDEPPNLPDPKGSSNSSAGADSNAMPLNRATGSSRDAKRFLPVIIVSLASGLAAILLS